MTPAQSRQISECANYLRLAKPAEREQRAQWLRDQGYPEAAIKAAQAQINAGG